MNHWHIKHGMVLCYEKPSPEYLCIPIENSEYIKKDKSGKLLLSLILCNTILSIIHTEMSIHCTQLQVPVSKKITTLCWSFQLN